LTADSYRVSSINVREDGSGSKGSGDESIISWIDWFFQALADFIDDSLIFNYLLTLVWEFLANVF